MKHSNFPKIQKFLIAEWMKSLKFFIKNGEINFPKIKNAKRFFNCELRRENFIFSDFYADFSEWGGDFGCIITCPTRPDFSVHFVRFFGRWEWDKLYDWGVSFLPKSIELEMNQNTKIIYKKFKTSEFL